MADEDDVPEQSEDELPEDMPNAADPDGVSKQRKKLRQIDREHQDVLRAILTTPQGRRWFAWLLHEVCGLYTPTENAAYDTHACHFREGGRAVGLILHKEALRFVKPQYMDVIRETLN